MVSPADSTYDRELVARIASGDQGAVAQLYDRHIRLVWGLVLRIMRSRAEAEDVIQDLFLRVWQQAGSFDPARGEVSVWLCQMARTMAIDRLRSGSSRTARELSYGTELEREKMSQSPSPATEADWARVAQAVRELPPDQRQLIESAYFDGLSQSEMAAKFGLPLGTVKTRIRMAMKKLRQVMVEQKVV